MARAHLHVTVREEIIDALEKGRGPMPLSRYVDTLLGVALGIDPPSLFEMRTIMPPRLTDYVDKEE